LGSVDHELNTSAFAVRVVASTGASLAACVSAGLSALSGPRHGGQTSLVEILFEEMEVRPATRHTIDHPSIRSAVHVRSKRKVEIDAA
jgi:citrate synthase